MLPQKVPEENINRYIKKDLSQLKPQEDEYENDFDDDDFADEEIEDQKLMIE